MNLKKLTLAAAAGTTLLAAAPVFADPGHGWRARHHHPHYVYGYGYPAPAYVYYPAQPVYVPPPVVYYPPPRPVIYGRIPLNHGTRIGFSVGL